VLNIDRRILAHFDFITVILLIPLIFTSGWLIYVIHPTLGQKHTVYVFVGIGVFITLFLLPIRRLLWMIPIAYWTSILLLIAVESVEAARLDESASSLESR